MKTENQGIQTVHVLVEPYLSCAAMFTRTVILIFFFVFTQSTAQDDDYWDRWSKNLESRINKQVDDSLRSLRNLGPTIEQRVHENLEPLQNLGPSIQQQVYEGLKPVRDMETRFRVKFGQDGRTIATFKDRKYIVQNGVLYKCEGKINDEDGSCSGELRKASFDKKEDFCYASSNTVINNWYCLSNGGSLNSGFINGRVYCNSSDNSPTLLISADEYKTLCGNKANPVHYKYFTSTPIGDHGPEVQCSGSRPSIVCTMTENGFNIIQGSTYIHIS